MGGFGVDLGDLALAAAELGRHKERAAATVRAIDRSHRLFRQNGAPGVGPLIRLGGAVTAPLLPLGTAIDELFDALRDHHRKIVRELTLAQQTLIEIRSVYAKGDDEPTRPASERPIEEAGLDLVTATLAGWHGAAAQAFHARVDQIQRLLRDHAGYTAWLRTHLAWYEELGDAARASAGVIAASTAEPPAARTLANDSLRDLAAAAATAARSVNAHLEAIRAGTNGKAPTLG